MVLAKNVYSAKDQVLLRSGTELDQRHLDKLQAFNIEHLCIWQPLSDELSDEEIQQLKAEENARRTCIEAVEIVKQVMSDVRMGDSLDLPKVRQTVSELCTQLIRDDRVLRYIDNLYAYDEYTFAHSIQVSVFTIILGKALHTPRPALEDIGTGGMLHDIGKTRVPLELLNLPRQYTAEEFAIMRNHPQYGEEILRETNGVPEIVIRMAGEHHERYNGTGYFRGLKGDQIHPYSQITALADVYDAMTTTRTYRPALLPQQAVEFLLTGVGSFFNPDLCHLFIKQVAIFPVGCVVQLTNGLIGKILEVDEKLPTRPVVGIIGKTKLMRITEIIDLRRRPDLLVARVVPQSELLAIKGVWPSAKQV